jgi:hypothetical protein
MLSLPFKAQITLSAFLHIGLNPNLPSESNMVSASEYRCLFFSFSFYLFFTQATLLI